jgi:hypothetical protein
VALFIVLDSSESERHPLRPLCKESLTGTLTASVDVTPWRPAAGDMNPQGRLMPGVIAGKVKERKRLHEQEFSITIQWKKKEEGS